MFSNRVKLISKRDSILHSIHASLAGVSEIHAESVGYMSENRQFRTMICAAKFADKVTLWRTDDCGEIPQCTRSLLCSTDESQSDCRPTKRVIVSP